ncbi:MAG: transcription antitermination factor NusB [bacterium]|nr:transcription antitermination factor NusB [bacterium]
MRARRKSRILAMSMLYAMEMQRDAAHGIARLVPTMYTRRFDQNVEDYAYHLVHTAMAHSVELDTLIRERAQNWRLQRMAILDRILMRIALVEMHYEPRLPAVICINEAIDIAKMYSTAESGHFINALLDAIRKEDNGSKPAPAPPPAAAPPPPETPPAE